MPKIGAERGFESGVGAEKGNNWRRDSPVGEAGWFAAAGGADVREPAPVCPCCRGLPCGGVVEAGGCCGMALCRAEQKLVFRATARVDISRPAVGRRGSGICPA
jgi:hypothetical protein